MQPARDESGARRLNEGDHLRIISMEKGGDVLGVFTRLSDGIKTIGGGVSKITGAEQPFMIHPTFGNVTCCPSNLGSGMRGSVHILVPKLIASIGFDKIDVLCRERNCQARGSSGEHSAVVDRIDVSNWRRIGFPEWELVEDMIKVKCTLQSSNATRACRLTGAGTGQCANYLAAEEDKI